MSVASASRFRHSFVPPRPSELRWSRNETVCARPSCTSSRKVCHILHGKNTHSSHRTRITVEVCNDYSLWPHSGLSSTSLAGLLFFLLLCNWSFIRDDSQSHPSPVACTSSRRRRGPLLHARTPPHSSPHYARSVSASAQLAQLPCGALQNSRPSSHGARRSSRRGTRPCQRWHRPPAQAPPFRPSHATARSASCSSPPRGMRPCITRSPGSYRR